MNILLAEYALAAAMGGTWELEGRAMLETIASSFIRKGHQVSYPTPGPFIRSGRAVRSEGLDGFTDFLQSNDADAGLIIAPEELLPPLLSLLPERMANLGCGAKAAALAADKLACTNALSSHGVPVADIVAGPDRPEMGCRMYVIKPRFGSGSSGVRMSSTPFAGDGEIATRYVEGVSISTSFIVGTKFLPLTINRQIIENSGLEMRYIGSEVPYNSPRHREIWDVSRRVAEILDLKGYAGIDFVLGDHPRVVDVNPRLTTSIFGISKVMKEELSELILAARFGSLPHEVHLEGAVSFTKRDLEVYNM